MSGDDFDDIAESLRDTIRALPEYDAYVDALEAVEADDDAQELLTEVRQLQNELHAAHQKGEAHDEHAELHEDLEAAQQKLDNLDVMQAYHDAAEDLAEELDEMNRTISEDLEINFAEFALPE